MAKIIIVIEDTVTDTSNIDARVMRFVKPSATDTDTPACKLADFLEAVLQAQLKDHGFGAAHMPSTVQH